MKVTIKDIAAAAMVSPATVSRVFSGTAYVSGEVRERVLHTAKTLGYCIRTGSRSRVIAVIVPADQRIPFEGYLGMIGSVLSEEIFRRGYRLELVPHRDVTILHERLICGAISLMFDDGLEKEWGALQRLPLVCINTSSRHIDGVYSVRSDEFSGIKMAVELLQCKGHRRIGMLTTSAIGHSRCNHYRCEGLIKAMQQAGMSEPPEFRTCVAPELIYEPLGQLLHCGITALICCGESFSPAVAYALAIYGRRIPADLSLIGYEFTGVSSFCLPQQTTLRQNFEEIGRQAVNLLEQLMSGQHPIADVVVNYQLIERETVAAAPVRE